MVVATEPRLAYTIPEVARLTTLSRATLYRLAARGDLTITKAGSRAIVTKDNLDAFLNVSKVRA